MGKGEREGSTPNTDANDFLALINKLHEHRDSILESSNRITKYANRLDGIERNISSIMNGERNLEVAARNAIKVAFDDFGLGNIFCEAQKEINSILSYSNELFPHLENRPAADSLNLTSHLLVLEMSLPAKVLVFNLVEIALGMRLFAESANKLRLNPSKKSMKQAFGIEIGLEWAKIKAYIERSYSNY